MTIGRDAEERRRNFVSFLENSITVTEEDLFEDMSLPRGDDDFLSKIALNNGRLMPFRAGRPRK
jgi:hypothetical protein